MILVALDTATPSTVAALRLADGRVLDARDDPGPGVRPRHAERLLALAEELLEREAVRWSGVGRLAVGVGPGGFTGLRIGVATGRALAQAHGLELVGVSSLEALAAGAAGDAGGRSVLAAVDARRGEAFAAAWAADGRPLRPPAALGPEALAGLCRDIGPHVLAVGDGTLRFRAELTEAGADVPPDDSPLQAVRGPALCALGASGTPVSPAQLLPDYLRAPDAKPPRPA